MEESNPPDSSRESKDVLSIENGDGFVINRTIEV